MLFTVSVDLADGGFFEFSTESILKFLQTAQMLGNADIEEVEDKDDEFDAFADCFTDGEEYEYDHDAGCWLKTTKKSPKKMKKRKSLKRLKPWQVLQGASAPFFVAVHCGGVCDGSWRIGGCTASLLRTLFYTGPQL